MDRYKGDLICEIDLFCATLPLKRGRHYSQTVTPLDNQYDAIARLQPFSNMMLSMYMCVELEFTYRRLRGQAMRYDIDNLAKAVLDNLQRQKIIVDDNQVISLSCVKSKGIDDHTKIRIYSVKDYEL